MVIHPFSSILDSSWKNGHNFLSRTRNIEIKDELCRAFAAISWNSRRPIIDDAVVIVVLTGRDVVPLGAGQRHRIGQEQTERQSRIDAGIHVVRRIPGAMRPMIIRPQVPVVGRKCRSIRIARIVPWIRFRKHALNKVAGCHIENTESLAEIQTQRVS